MFEFLLFRGVANAILILVNAYFTAAELALFSVRQMRVEPMVAAAHPGACLGRHLQEHLDDFLSAVQLGVTVVPEQQVSLVNSAFTPIQIGG